MERSSACPSFQSKREVGHVCIFVSKTSGFFLLREPRSLATFSFEGHCAAAIEAFSLRLLRCFFCCVELGARVERRLSELQTRDTEPLWDPLKSSAAVFFGKNIKQKSPVLGDFVAVRRRRS